MEYDYVVVGAGLTGATLARCLTDAGYHVRVVERRKEVAGNCHDFIHATGIRMNSHGPHYFRTNSDRIWGFVNRFCPWYEFRAAVLIAFGSGYHAWPLRLAQIKAVDRNWQPADTTDPLPPAGNFEARLLQQVPQAIYDHFIRGYTGKQWGVEPRLLDVELASRIDIRNDDDPALKLAKYQALPRHGYTNFVESMLAGVEVSREVDYFGNADLFRARHRTFFTGPIDQFYAYRLGELKYRTQRRFTVYHSHTPQYQPTIQVNYPSKRIPHIRSIEWKHALPEAERKQFPGTVVTYEFPKSVIHADEYEYPFPDKENRQLYQKYQELAAKDPEVVFCGRLGEYRYYDMDQAIARALALAEREIRREK